MTLMESLAELRAYTMPRLVDRRTDPHLRCGVCQETFETGERTVYVDDERCHPECAQEAA